MTMHQIPCSTPDPDLVRLVAVSQTPLPLAASQSVSRTSAQSGHSAGTTHSIRATTQPAGRRRWLRAVLAVAALGVGGVAQAQDPGTTPPRTAADDVFGGTPETPTVIRGSGLMVMPMGTIDDLTLVVGEPPHQEEVADKFKSTYPNLLRYSAVSSNMAAATVSVSGSVGDGDACRTRDDDRDGDRDQRHQQRTASVLGDGAEPTPGRPAAGGASRRRDLGEGTDAAPGGGRGRVLGRSADVFGGLVEPGRGDGLGVGVRGDGDADRGRDDDRDGDGAERRRRR